MTFYDLLCVTWLCDYDCNICDKYYAFVQVQNKEKKLKNKIKKNKKIKIKIKIKSSLFFTTPILPAYLSSSSTDLTGYFPYMILLII